jgi:hypothetical protein
MTQLAPPGFTNRRAGLFAPGCDKRKGPGPKWNGGPVFVSQGLNPDRQKTFNNKASSESSRFRQLYTRRVQRIKEVNLRMRQLLLSDPQTAGSTVATSKAVILLSAISCRSAMRPSSPFGLLDAALRTGRSFRKRAPAARGPSRTTLGWRIVTQSGTMALAGETKKVALVARRTRACVLVRKVRH